MSAARIVTTTEKFDEAGKLVERITTEKFLEEYETDRRQEETRACRCNSKATEEDVIRFMNDYKRKVGFSCFL